MERLREEGGKGRERESVCVCRSRARALLPSPAAAVAAVAAAAAAATAEQACAEAGVLRLLLPGRSDRLPECPRPCRDD